MANSDKKLTPLMKQYWDVKSVHMDKILFFRMGDFYELFDQDAVTAAPILGIALTTRNKNQADATAMCGMPHHSVANYINKLLSHNFKVAICDQIEDPATAKGIVKRAVTRILSPGMVYDPETLDQGANNYICSYDDSTVSFLDATTGEAFFYKFGNEVEKQKLIHILRPVELVLDANHYKKYLENKADLTGPCVTEHNELADKNIHTSAARLISYAVAMQGEKVLQTLGEFEERFFAQRMELNFQTIKHLEIFETYRGETKGSFFQAINKTKTAAGARKLKNWILFPLQNETEILARQNQVEYWMNNSAELKRIRQVLGEMGDIERRLGKISNPTCNARDFIALKNSLVAGLQVSELSRVGAVKPTAEASHNIYKMVSKIENTIVDEPPLSTKNGHMIRAGFSADLDHLIKLSEDSQGLLSEMEAQEKEKYQIPSLKIRYNSVFGFYIEVTKTHTDKVPKHYVRKQTLTNAERYTTDELYKLEQQVLSAKTKREELEFGIFESLRNEILKNAQELLRFANEWSEVDVITSLAWLALEMNYTKPTFAKDRSLRLKSSRHPVIEQLTAKPFVPNDIEIAPNGCMLLTGPNMAGKSTLMRQVALTAILAQMGSFIPAKESSLPIFDRVFTRIGASDNLSEGLSTFMVEMTETAYLLKNSTEKSLVILDEIGRGTSTYDGMSLAQAILEYLVTQVRATIFFATHYHEITSLQGRYPQIENAHMKVAEVGNGKSREITFLYTLTRGPANKSYGIEVAKLAGLPSQVTNLAKKILEQKENSTEESLPLFSSQIAQLSEGNDEISEIKIPDKYRDVIEEISQFPVAQTSPLDALIKIEDWKRSLN